MLLLCNHFCNGSGCSRNFYYELNIGNLYRRNQLIYGLMCIIPVYRDEILINLNGLWRPWFKLDYVVMFP
jgi:hypothetical protein